MKDCFDVVCVGKYFEAVERLHSTKTKLTVTLCAKKYFYR